jgi:hypothetical protein
VHSATVNNGFIVQGPSYDRLSLSCAADKSKAAKFKRECCAELKRVEKWLREWNEVQNGRFKGEWDETIYPFNLVPMAHKALNGWFDVLSAWIGKDGEPEVDDAMSIGSSVVDHIDEDDWTQEPDGASSVGSQRPPTDVTAAVATTYCLVETTVTDDSQTPSRNGL